MVHNGIEYGDMQLIAEAYSLLKDGADLTHDEMAEVSQNFLFMALCRYSLVFVTSIMEHCFCGMAASSMLRILFIYL